MANNEWTFRNNYADSERLSFFTHLPFTTTYQSKSSESDKTDDKASKYRTTNVGSAFLVLDQLAKPTFRSRYAHTPFGSAPLPTLSS